MLPEHLCFPCKRSMAGMLADGSNPEYVDPAPPIEWKSKDDLGDVVLYGNAGSQPTAKIAAILVYSKVPFKRTGGKKKGTPYTKVPVMDAGGRQVNDSGIILKYLLPVVGIKSDAEWDSKIGTEWDCTMREHMSKSDAGRFAAKFLLPCGCCGVCLGGVIRSVLDKKVAQNKQLNEKYRSHPSGGFLEPCKDFKAEFKGSFHGGDTPDGVDISVYGFCLPGMFAKQDMFVSAIEGAGLSEWWAKMEEAIPMNDVLFGTKK